MSTVKNIVYATDRSKAVVPVLFLILCSFMVYTTGRLMFSMSPRVLFPRFSVCFSSLITLLGEEGAGLCASGTFVSLFCVCIFLSFFSPAWCRGLAKFVIVAYTGPFY